MNKGISNKILEEEVVKYISERHHTTAQYLISHLSDFELEENEVKIVQDLSRMYE